MEHAPMSVSISAVEFARLEVEWYREHGRHPERVVRDTHPASKSSGLEMVVCDFSWNYHRPRQRETIQHQMVNGILDKLCGWKP